MRMASQRREFLPELPNFSTDGIINIPFYKINKKHKKNCQVGSSLGGGAKTNSKY